MFMKLAAAALSVVVFGLPVSAQTDLAPITGSVQERASRADSALLRALDKVSGRSTDINLAVGEAKRLGRIEVRLGECRFPTADPSSDAYAQLIISDISKNTVLFSGWMIASSPALSALDDARYDIWVISCES